MNELVQLDKFLFTKINGVWTSNFLDSIMPVLTDLHKELWFQILAPAFVFYWLSKKRWHALHIFAGMVLAFALSDTISHRAIKPLFQRDRPHNVMSETVQLRSHKHAGYSFPSNHAANMFSIGTFLGGVYPTMRFVFWGIALLIAYSRVYVGVHFPFDVLGGALLGIFCGSFVFLLWKKATGFFRSA